LIDPLLEKIFLFWEDNHYADPDLQSLKLRTKIFIEEARKQNAEIQVLKNKNRQTNNFRLTIQNKTIHFTSLPLAEHKNGKIFHQIDDKLKCKKILSNKKFPTPEGRGFWFFQKKRALKYGLKLGFPLVVKPRFGSVSRHVTTNITNKKELFLAIKYTLEYAPTFIIEKYLQSGFVHRVTIIDQEKIFCAKQIPAHVIGDGASTIEELITLKNLDPKRDGSFYYPLIPNSNINLNKILPDQEIKFIQTDPFMKLGGDIEEVTNKIHKKNLYFFNKIAKELNIKIIGLDFICDDITEPFYKQPCGILEINTLPCIEMHHLPSIGPKQNPAKYIFELTKKYYL